MHSIFSTSVMNEPAGWNKANKNFLKPTMSKAELEEYFAALILTKTSKTEIYYLDPLLGDDISMVTSGQSPEEFFLIKYL